MSCKIKWRHQYDAEADATVRALSDIDCSGDEPLTQQQFREDADINVLVERFKIAREPFPEAVADPRYYGDVSEAPDLRTVLERARSAQEHFNGLPVRIRNRFRNSPAELYEFVMDEGNRAEAEALGLLEKREPAVPAPAVVTSEASTPSTAAQPAVP